MADPVKLTAADLNKLLDQVLALKNPPVPKNWPQSLPIKPLVGKDMEQTPVVLDVGGKNYALYLGKDNKLVAVPADGVQKIMDEEIKRGLAQSGLDPEERARLEKIDTIRLQPNHFARQNNDTVQPAYSMTREQFDASGRIGMYAAPQAVAQAPNNNNNAAPAPQQPGAQAQNGGGVWHVWTVMEKDGPNAGKQVVISMDDPKFKTATRAKDGFAGYYVNQPKQPGDTVNPTYAANGGDLLYIYDSKKKAFVDANDKPYRGDIQDVPESPAPKQQTPAPARPQAPKQEKAQVYGVPGVEEKGVTTPYDPLSGKNGTFALAALKGDGAAMPTTPIFAPIAAPSETSQPAQQQNNSGLPKLI